MKRIRRLHDPFLPTLLSGCLMAISLVPLPALAQQDPDGIFDWPIGSTIVEGLGRVGADQYYIQQNFNNMDGPSGLSPSVCGRGHAGVDLSYPNGELAAGKTVYAAADGVVECVKPSQFPGRAIVVRHQLPDGSRLWSLYGHMDNCTPGQDADCPAKGDILRRGQPVGEILDWSLVPDGAKANSHLHFEIRRFPYWDRGDNNNATDDEGPSFTVDDCTGRGYAAPPAGVPLHGGYLNPTDVILSTRPTPPEKVVVRPGEGIELRSAPRDSSTLLAEIPEETQLTPLGTVRDAQFQCGLTDPRADWECNSCSQGDASVYCTDSCKEGACDWWYKVVYEPEGEAPQTGYVKIIDKREGGFQLPDNRNTNGYRSIILVGEPIQPAPDLDVAPWRDPEGIPLVRYYFDPPQDDVREIARNSGTDPSLNGRIEGTFQRRTPEIPVPFEEHIALDGETSYLEVQNSALLFSRSGFDLRLQVLRNTDDSEDVLAGQWDPDDPVRQRWLLTFLPGNEAAQRDAELRFQVRLAGEGGAPGEIVSASYILPSCEYLGQWVTVQASYDPTRGLRLYWDGRQVAHTDLDGGELAGIAVPLRLGGNASDEAVDASRLDGRLDRFFFWSEAPDQCIDVAFVIDTTGSMGDDISAVKAASTELVDVIFGVSGCSQVGVVDFRDLPRFGRAGDYAFRLQLQMSQDPVEIRSALLGLTLGHGGNTPESVFSGLMGAMLNLNWRPDAPKFIILLGDAEPHSPEPDTGFTLQGVINTANNGGVLIPFRTPTLEEELKAAVNATSLPIEIYAVHIGFRSQARAAFQALAEGTSGQYLNAPRASDVVDALIDALLDIGEGQNRPPIADARGDQMVECTGDGSADITLDGTGSFDPEGAALTYAWSAPGIFFDDATASVVSAAFPLGTTPVALLVNDGTLNSAASIARITVMDTTAPEILALGASPDLLWPPNHRMRRVEVEVEATDSCDGVPPTCWISKVLVEEAPDGSGDGNSEPDWEILDDLTVELRAERSGSGGDRIYDIEVVCRDDSGNEAVATTPVVVPHDRR